MILHEIRTELYDPNVERLLNTGIAPLILLCWRGDGIARPDTSLDRCFALRYQPARLGLELWRIALASEDVATARTLHALRIPVRWDGWLLLK
jgi:hypothetical protein